MAHGEILRPNSPLVTVAFGYRLKGWRKLDEKGNGFVATNALGAIARPAIWGVLKARPYALRAYFDSQLLIAESHGCMTHAYRQFFMGHKGDMEARYTTNKGKLTEQMTEDMRRAFGQSRAFLSADATYDSEKDRRRMLIGMWRQQAKMYGLDPDDVLAGGTLDGTLDVPPSRQSVVVPTQDGSAGRNDGAVASVTALEADKGVSGAGKTSAAAVRAADAAPAAAANNKAPGQSPFESRIADGESELLAGTAEGWELVNDLPGERFLIRRKIPRS